MKTNIAVIATLQSQINLLERRASLDRNTAC
jgi:hypothetical protein